MSRSGTLFWAANGLPDKLLLRVIIRNWMFGLMKKDGYDWQYEKAIVKAAIRDAHGSKEKKYIQLKIRVSEGYHHERALKGNF